ncbi:MAG: hypothetical protein AAF546_00355 [Verrucomicrobiota bacterium]
MTGIRWWQWFNVLAVDAAVIAVAWQHTLASGTGEMPGFGASTVLALSVWLTYTADRLFDVRRKSIHDLLSVRHQFAKTYFLTLWKIWAVILGLNVAIAILFLSRDQLSNGLVLLAGCLIYTFINQKIASRFFPKEFFVASIFACGAAVFIELPLMDTFALALLCLLNCLLISGKEVSIDRALQIRSLSSDRYRNRSSVLAILLMSSSLPLIPTSSGWPIALSAIGLGIIYLRQDKIHLEKFRVYLDSTLLVGPSLRLLAAAFE